MTMLFLDIETLGLNALDPQLRIVSIAMRCDGVEYHIEARKAEDERGLLNTLHVIISGLRPTTTPPMTLCTYNGASFDVPYIVARSCRYGLVAQATALLELPHLDLVWVKRKYMQTQSYDSDRGQRLSTNLSTFAKFLGIEVAEDISGREVVTLAMTPPDSPNYEAAWATIKAHNQHDCTLLEAIYERIAELCEFDLRKRYEKKEGNDNE